MSESADMSPYCPVHDELLIMKLCMYVGYHDANHVSTFGGDPVITSQSAMLHNNIKWPYQPKQIPSV